MQCGNVEFPLGLSSHLLDYVFRKLDQEPRMNKPCVALLAFKN